MGCRFDGNWVGGYIVDVVELPHDFEIHGEHFMAEIIMRGRVRF